MTNWALCMGLFLNFAVSPLFSGPYLIAESLAESHATGNALDVYLILQDTVPNGRSTVSRDISKIDFSELRIQTAAYCSDSLSILGN